MWDERQEYQFSKHSIKSQMIENKKNNDFTSILQIQENYMEKNYNQTFPDNEVVHKRP